MDYGQRRVKEDEFQDDRESLTDFYHNHGYLDFEIKDVKFEQLTANTLAIRFYLYEGRQYKVGSVVFTGNKLFNAEDIHRDDLILEKLNQPDPVRRMLRGDGEPCAAETACGSLGDMAIMRPGQSSRLDQPSGGWRT